MSVITTKKDYSTNNPLDAGYFRVGFVTLQIPPQDIVTLACCDNEKITPLRGMKRDVPEDRASSLGCDRELDGPVE